MNNTKLTSAQDAINQAIEGGWKAKQFVLKGADAETILDLIEVEIEINPHILNTILTDPLFWQALGKARGWGKIGGDAEYDPIDQWKASAVEWFEARLLNGNETKFWESLP